MDRLRHILDEHESGIQNIMYHKGLDFQKRHLVWKQNCLQWTRQGKVGIPYPEPQMYPEYLVRKNNLIHFSAEDLESIYQEIKKEIEYKPTQQRKNDTCEGR